MEGTLSSRRRGSKVVTCFVIAFALSHQAPEVSRMLTAEHKPKSAGRTRDHPSSRSSNVDVTIQTDTTHMKESTNPVLELWNEYKEQHSHRSLSHEWWELRENGNLENKSNIDLNGRKFSVGFYSCPLQAGNRLHHFFNSLIWSIVTNRTILYRYFDQKACFWTSLSEGGGDLTKCRVANQEKDCNKILKRNDWIPSFDEWKTKLHVKNMTSFSFWSTVDKRPKHRLWSNESEKYAGIVDVRDDLMVNYAPMLGQDAAILQYAQKRKYLLSTQKAQNRAKQLLSLGEDYLYGMLFEHCFQFRTSILQEEKSPLSPTNDTDGVATAVVNHESLNAPIMIAVHSRHSKTSDDGSKIKRETKCLDQLLKTMKTSNDSKSECVVVLLSDRPKTLTLLQEYLAQNYSQCTSLIAKHEEGESWRPEHGPFAGVGFYQDLALVKNTIQSLPESPRSQVGFIGSHHRSSSQLVREILVYQQLSRNTEYEPTVDEIAPIATCYL
ncbi:unnamed protein product [Cylindrotheca closterium]|uniref:Uncharacterized protein n=1 Tax=Cylindrotheca closterium TaxID=2856 RepID=A0AAD2JGZ8_9STRA|nr:unnamed protein product [Cylindrotheca closterium]